jgi:hypothetical protein
MAKRTAKPKQKKSVAKAAVSSSKVSKFKGYQGLKYYVIVAITLSVLSFISVIGFSVSALKNITANLAIATLPETGKAASYYSKCIINIPGGFEGMSEGSVVDCTYRTDHKDSEYSFDSGKFYLSCKINDVIRMNSCEKGLVKK